MSKIPVRHIKEPHVLADFKIRDLGILLTDGDMIQPLHRHDFFFLLAVANGAGVHEIDFISHTIEEHSIFFMRPGQVHQLNLHQGSTGYLIEFNTEFYSPRDKQANDILRKVSAKNHCRLHTDRFHKALSILNTIYQEYDMKQANYANAIRANLEIFFIELVRQSSNPTSHNNENTYSQERLEELLTLLERQVTSQKRVSHYADVMHLTPYQLNAITKSTLGKTCSELINDYILLEAKRQILATSEQINQIAYQLGYEDVSYFIRFFKSHTGSTPEAFRLNFR